MKALTNIIRIFIALAVVAGLTSECQGQKNVVNIYFPVHVAIQDLGLGEPVNNFTPVFWGEGVWKVVVRDEPIHLLVYTDQNRYNLVIFPADKKVKVPKYQWREVDKAIDLSLMQ